MLPFLHLLAALLSPWLIHVPTRIAILELGTHESPAILGDTTKPSDFSGIIPDLVADEARVVVIRVHGHGSHADAVELAQLLHSEYQPRFRTVAWLHDVRGGACKAVWVLPELYAAPDAAIGPCTLGAPSIGGPGFNDTPDVEAALRDMRSISVLAGRDPSIMASMQSMQPLSATIDPSVVFSNDTRSQHVLNPDGAILTLDAASALRFGIVRAIAETPDELAAAMGIANPVWTGDRARARLNALRDARASSH